MRESAMAAIYIFYISGGVRKTVHTLLYNIIIKDASTIAKQESDRKIKVKLNKAIAIRF